MTGARWVPADAPGGPAAPAVVVHGDDCALTPGMTEAVMRCHDEGVLERTSLLATGHAWRFAVEAVRARPRLRPVLHLDLAEGRALGPAEADLLCDDAGFFRHDFLTLWSRYELAGPGLRARLRLQVRGELRRQLVRFAEAFGDAPVPVDGHQHLHMIPFVFEELLALADEGLVASVRLPRETWYEPAPGDGLAQHPAANVAKHALLNALARAHAPSLERRGLVSEDAFAGVLGSGRMTAGHVRAAREAAARMGASTIEVLFHPGVPAPEEAPLLARRPAFARFHCSPGRAREAQVLCGGALAALLGVQRPAPAPGPAPLR